MAKKRHRPPSRERYERTHPVISVRMPKEWVDELDAFLVEQGLSRGDFFRTSFEKQKANYHRAYLQGDKDGYGIGHSYGYEKGKIEYGIWYFCIVCGKAIYILPNSDAHKAMIGYMKENRWGHTECPEQ